MRHPVVGVTCSTRSGWRIFPLLAFNLRLAGGRAVRWDTRRAVDLDAVDAVIIGGGDDIGPALYGGEIVTEARIDPDRDALEIRIARAALERGLPILGICRGAQMLNVATGGTLHADAFAAHPGSRRYRTVLPRRSVACVPGSDFASLMGRETIRVNALHSQSIDRLGRGFRVAARDEGGMVQAIEAKLRGVALGVQWHPEHLFYRSRQRRIFAALVEAARCAATVPDARVEAA